MVVLGSRGLGGFTGMLIGSTAVGVTAHGHCPVVVARGSEGRTGPVVVGVDGSPTSELALAMAFEEASLRRAELIAVHAWSDVPTQSYAAANRTLEQWDAEQVKAEELLAERVAGYREKYPDVVVTRSVTKDQPVANLLAHAAVAQLVVVGSRGRGTFSGLLLGSTSQAMIYHAPCPVLVAREQTG
jgi:nucleotide-binding universal stress UspA family protein